MAPLHLTESSVFTRANNEPRTKFAASDFKWLKHILSSDYTVARPGVECEGDRVDCAVRGVCANIKSLNGQSPVEGASPLFDVYGYRFRVSSNSEWALDGIAQDFSYFRTEPNGGGALVEMVSAEPDYSSLPSIDAAVYTPRNVVYKIDGRSYIDYSGRGLAIHDPASGSFRITSLRKDLLYESAYLFLLSQIGQALDRNGLHRLHALAVSIRGKAILVLLPMGGGKSTLGGALLEHPEIKLLSDDSPFIDSSGNIHAFPLHLGLLPGQEETVPPEHRRRIDRMEFGVKHLVNIDYYADRLIGSAEPGLVLLGHRNLGEECRIERAGTVAALRAMVANCVVGLGLFHGLEFILSASPWELASKVSLGASRLSNCMALLRRSETCYLRMGRNVKENARAVVEYADPVL